MDELLAQEQRESDIKEAKVQHVVRKNAMMFKTAVP